MYKKYFLIVINLMYTPRVLFSPNPPFRSF